MAKYFVQASDEKVYTVYLAASRPFGALYIGVTSDISKRMYEHKNKLVKGFTSRYSIDRLVYYEDFDEVEFAIEREKKLKKWERQWKIELIVRHNPEWEDLYYRL